MNTLEIIVITLIVYSLISTVTYLITGQNGDILEIFGFGIVGFTLLGACALYAFIYNISKYHIGKRSIFKENATGNKYKCETKYANDIYDWNYDYKLIKRYAIKSEYENIPDFSKEFIEKTMINCDRCKHLKECENHMKCEHDPDDLSTMKFENFEKKSMFRR